MLHSPRLGAGIRGAARARAAGALLLLLLVAGGEAARAQETLAAGAGDFEWKDEKGNAERPIRVFYYKPENLEAGSPIVFVMHGMKRNGKTYRDEWEARCKASRTPFLVVTPEFSRDVWKGANEYDLGWMFDRVLSGHGLEGQELVALADRRARPREKWTYTAIEHLFDHVKKKAGLTRDTYFIYGHSAGGQFVHRFVLFNPNGRWERAVAANPGWYSEPVFRAEKPLVTADFPYGLNGSAASEDDLKASFARDFVLLLGEADNDPNHPELERTPEAEAEGPHRLARGEAYFARAREVAGGLGASFRWRLETVPRANHDSAKMSPTAAKIFFPE
jgi:poly(3-hydroxybutyrate) depolymerase